MFGLLRTVLAIIVMVGHLLDTWQIGTYAVFGFYMISGYLMTYIMQENYGFSATGRFRFATNRFLRLYPLYWIAAVISLVIIAWVGTKFSRSFHSGLYLPSGLNEVVANLTMVYPKIFANEYTPILVPTTWAITVELFFYACICLGLSKTPKRVIVWLLVSIAYVLYCLYLDLGWRYRYFPILAGSLPFSLGAGIYFLVKKDLPRLDDFILKPTMLLLGLVLNMLAVILYPYYFEMGFYINALLSVLVCYQIAAGESWAGISLRVDKIIGEFSYPIYLLHWQAGIVASYFLFSEPIHEMSYQGASVLALALLLVFLLSFVLVRVVDRPVQRLRYSLKNR